MKRIIFLLSFVAFTAVFYVGCNKNKAFKKETGQDALDNQNVQSESDNAINDVDNAVSGIHAMNGKVIHISGALSYLTNGIPCGASVDTTQITQGILTLNFDGVTVCWNRKRGGFIKATLQNFTSGMRWDSAGAVLQLDFTNYKVTRASDGKSVEFNGTKTVTNVTGGNLVGLWLQQQSSLTHKVVASNMHVTFDGVKTATWNINRQFTFTYSVYNSTGIFTCTGEGLGTNNGISNLENWGTTRDGDPFTSQVVSPVVWNTTCGYWAPVTGQLDIKVQSKSFDLVVLIGVDSNGNAVTPTPNNCPYGLKVSWTWNSKTGSKIYPYI